MEVGRELIQEPFSCGIKMKCFYIWKKHESKYEEIAKKRGDGDVKNFFSREGIDKFCVKPNCDNRSGNHPPYFEIRNDIGACRKSRCHNHCIFHVSQEAIT